MVYYYIVGRSLTDVQNMAELLRRAGISAELMRTPRNAGVKSCGSSVRINEQELGKALGILKRAGVSEIRVFVRYADGSSRELS